MSFLFHWSIFQLYLLTVHMSSLSCEKQASFILFNHRCLHLQRRWWVYVWGKHVYWIKNPTIFTICSFTIVLKNVVIYGLTCPALWKGGANTLRALLTLEKYEKTNHDICVMRRYGQNIFQWNKNDIKSTRMTTGDYYILLKQLLDGKWEFLQIRQWRSSHNQTKKWQPIINHKQCVCSLWWTEA